METNHVTVEYGSHKIDFATLPATSQIALVSRGLTHFLGNEQASKLQAWAIKESGADKIEDAAQAKSTVKDWKSDEVNAEKVEAKMAELQTEAMAALMAGTVGVRISGPRATPLDSKRRQLARVEVLGVLSGAGVKVPKKDEQIKLGENLFTLDELIARRLAHAEHGPRITKEAEKAIAAEAKKLEGLKAGAETAIADL